MLTSGETALGDGPLPPTALMWLATWLSPAFPVGSFAWSGGLEWAVEACDVTDAESLRRWLAVSLSVGGFGCDAALLVHAYRAVMTADDADLHDVAELASALAPSRERYEETTAQGDAFVTAVSAAWPCRALHRLAQVWSRPLAYPVAVGVAAAGHGIPLRPALHLFVHALVANAVSAGVRLVPLGQTDGLKVTAALEPATIACAARAMVTPRDDIGSAAFRADLASMRHETQYTRLFRS